MSWVQTILTPIITGVFIGGFVLWSLFLIYKGIKKTYPNINFWVKYTIFRKKVDERVVEWCMDAISKDMSNLNVEKFLLMKGVKPKRIKETIYIYDQVLDKTLEGGINIKNEQLRQSNEQIEIPKIS